MNQKLAMIVALLAASVCGAVASDEIELTIGQDKQSNEIGCISGGDKIPLELTFTNVGEKTESVVIIDHNLAGLQQPYPNMLSIRVVDSRGLVLTAASGSCDSHDCGWWSHELITSTIYQSPDDPGNRIQLPPGAAIQRVYDVTEVAGGCSMCPLYLYEFPPGRYSIQLRLSHYGLNEYQDLRSNEYEIDILPKGKSCE